MTSTPYLEGMATIVVIALSLLLFPLTLIFRFLRRREDGYER